LPDAATPSQTLPARLALPVLVLGACAIGTAPILIRFGQASPGAIAFWRMAIAGPLLVVLVSALRPPPPDTAAPTGLRRYLLLMLPGVFFAGDMACWNWSLTHTLVATSTLLTNTAPILVTIAAWLLYRERPNWRFLLALLLAFIGAAFLIGESLQIGGDTLFGDLMALAAAGFYAGYLLSIARLRRWADTRPLMAVSACTAAILLLPVAIWEPSPDPFLPLDASGWAAIIALAVLCHVLGQGGIAFALAHLPTGFSALTLLIQPVIATLLAWWLFAEELSGGQILGGILVLGGITLARLSLRRR